MANIKVRVGQQNTIGVRVGQQNAIKVISSNLASTGDIYLSEVNDIDITNRSNRTFLMYDSATQKYVHVNAAQVVDLADGIDDDSFDGGSF